MKKLYVFLAIAFCMVLAFTACAPKETVTVPTAEAVNPLPPPEEVTETEVATCLIVGATYGGPITDAGYNQAMHEAVMTIQEQYPCVQIIEAENVYDEAGAKSTMENMIAEGATMIIATAYAHQQPAYDLSQTNPDVIFEHAGGWMMGANFANFFAKPPDLWYLMGVAAGQMTESNKLGFVAAFPQAWTDVFVNAYALGAESVNPDVQVIVSYTFSWGDSAKEADTTNALINQGCDVITMNVDSPATVLSTAESRGVWSIGYQDLAAQQFAPEYWITGSGLTLGNTLAWLASTVMDGTWTPIFLRCGFTDGCMAIAPFGQNVPQSVIDQFDAVKAQLEAGTLTVFAGPITDQEGNIKVAAGSVLTDDEMSNVDWFVQGVVGSPK
jgi:basic membrane protein A